MYCMAHTHIMTRSFKLRAAHSTLVVDARFKMFKYINKRYIICGERIKQINKIKHIKLLCIYTNINVSANKNNIR